MTGGGHSALPRARHMDPLGQQHTCQRVGMSPGAEPDSKGSSCARGPEARRVSVKKPDF
jgi:hypothetical protein